MMDIAFCTSKDYLKGYGVLMLSILHFAPPQQQERLCFHILSDELDDADKALLEGIAARRENTSVAFYAPAKEFDEKTINSLPARSGYCNWPRATYYDLLIADLLPPDVHRALYLDGDIVCTGSLEELFAIDMKGCPCAMVAEPVASYIQLANRLGYPAEEGYFNSGVILLDLDLWRRENISQAMLGYFAANAKKIHFADQDINNAVLHGRILPLDYSYNVCYNAFYVFYWIDEEKNNYYAASTQYLPRKDWPALRAAVERPRLVHCALSPAIKFWYSNCPNPFAPVWRYFYAQSPWAGEPLKRYRRKLPAKTKIKRLARRALEVLHLATPQPSIPYPEEAYKSAQRVLEEVSR